MKNVLEQFFATKNSNIEAIKNERGLQLELGLMFRQRGYRVLFEVPCDVCKHQEQKKKQKRNIDLLVIDQRKNERYAIELKVPFSGRVPETMYDFCADIAFIEAVTNKKKDCIGRGICILVTSDKLYWSGGKESGIYAPFRKNEYPLSGKIKKPTGLKKADEWVYINGSYLLSWVGIGNRRLLPDGGKFLIVEVHHG